MAVEATRNQCKTIVQAEGDFEKEGVEFSLWKGTYEFVDADPKTWPRDRILMFFIIETLELFDGQITAVYCIVPISWVSTCFKFVLYPKQSAIPTKNPSQWALTMFKKNCFPKSVFVEWKVSAIINLHDPKTFSKAVKHLSDKQRDPENYQWLPSEPEGQITKRVSIPNRRLLQDYVTDAPQFTNQMTETLGPKQPQATRDLLDPAATYFDLERTEAPGPSTQQAPRGPPASYLQLDETAGGIPARHSNQMTETPGPKRPQATKDGSIGNWMTAPFQIDSNASYLLSDDVEVGGGTQATVPAHPNVRNTTVHPNVMTALVHPNRITAQQHQHNNMDQANCPGPSQQIGDGGILTPIRSIGINHPNGQFGGPFHSSPLQPIGHAVQPYKDAEMEENISPLQRHQTVARRSLFGEISRKEFDDTSTKVDTCLELLNELVNKRKPAAVSDYHETLVKRELRNAENVPCELPEHVTALNIILSDQKLAISLVFVWAEEFENATTVNRFMVLCLKQLISASCCNLVHWQKDCVSPIALGGMVRILAAIGVAGQAYCRNKNHPIVTASTVMQVLRTARKNIAAVYRKQKNLKATRAEDDMEDKAQTRATQELLVKYMTSLAIAVEKFKLPRQ